MIYFQLFMDRTDDNRNREGIGRQGQCYDKNGNQFHNFGFRARYLEHVNKLSSIFGRVMPARDASC